VVENLSEAQHCYSYAIDPNTFSISYEFKYNESCSKECRSIYDGLLNIFGTTPIYIKATADESSMKSFCVNAWTHMEDCCRILSDKFNNNVTYLSRCYEIYIGVQTTSLENIMKNLKEELNEYFGIVKEKLKVLKSLYQNYTSCEK
jgi:hypothetical protein